LIHYPQFENVARAIFFKLREQFDFAHVEGSQHYPAKDSGVKRQVDITAYRNDGGMVLIECKLHKEPIDIGYVDAFHTVIYTDVGAERGILVSSRGFTDGAVKSANAKQIGLATLNADATENDFTLQIAELILKGVSRDITCRLILVDGTSQGGTDEADSTWSRDRGSD
jgi:predicted helicase